MRKLVIFFALSLAAEQRMSLHWLVREDIFSGLLANDRARLEKGAKTLDAVASFYPPVDVTAWRGSIELMRAVWAHEDGKTEDFRRHYAISMAYFDECRNLSNEKTAIIPEIFEGGTYVVIADRLPENLRRGAWERCYRAYKKLNALEASRVDRLPLHMKGEIISGLAVATQRTGRTDELPAALQAVETKLAGSVYANAAKKWTADPASASKVRMACLTCHEANTLGPKLEQLHKVN
jgi:hypothetical protein